jgi:CheY-like chemotaxis protein
LTFIAELRNSRNARLSKIPVIATTVSYEDMDARRAREAGFDVFLRKPLEPDHLPKIVALLLAASMSSAPPST